jgi:hypothetical protein
VNLKRRSIAALAVAPLLLAACSNEGGGTDGDSGTAASSSAATNRDKAVKFAECMRENGVTEFPDPNGSGELTIDGVVNGSSIDPNGPVWNGAIDACRELQPPGFTGGGERSADQQDAALKFAQCIRENGVEDFPDPAAGQPLVDTNRIPSANTAGGMSILNAAMQKCSSYSEELGIQGQ